MIGVALESPVPSADHAELIGGAGAVLVPFCFRDVDRSQLRVVAGPPI
jgi:hypothetical protein